MSPKKIHVFLFTDPASRGFYTNILPLFIEQVTEEIKIRCIHITAITLEVLTVTDNDKEIKGTDGAYNYNGHMLLLGNIVRATGKAELFLLDTWTTFCFQSRNVEFLECNVTMYLLTSTTEIVSLTGPTRVAFEFHVGQVLYCDNNRKKNTIKKNSINKLGTAPVPNWNEHTEVS